MATDEKSPAVFDFASLKTADTTDVTLVNPVTGEDIAGTFITVYGQDSDVYRAARNKLQAKAADYKAKHRNKDMPPDVSDSHYRRLIIAATKCVTGLVYGGKTITDPEEAYNLPGCGWIFEQVAVAMNDRALFIKA